MPPLPESTCGSCHEAMGAARRSMCSRCRAVHYCDGTCQAAHWPEHKRGAWAARGAGAGISLLTCCAQMLNRRAPQCASRRKRSRSTSVSRWRARRTAAERRRGGAQRTRRCQATDASLRAGGESRRIGRRAAACRRTLRLRSETCAQGAKARGTKLCCDRRMRDALRCHTTFFHSIGRRVFRAQPRSHPRACGASNPRSGAPCNSRRRRCSGRRA